MIAKHVAHTGNMAELIAMRACCEAAGIHCFDPIGSASVSFAGVDHGYYLDVLPAQVVAARAVISDSPYAHLLIEDD